MTDKSGKNILGEDGLPIETREYHFTRQDGSKVVIQEHSAGHTQFDDEGAAATKPHFNVRDYDFLTGNGKRKGGVANSEKAAGHYVFER